MEAAVVGAGPAGLMAAEVLAQGGARTLQLSPIAIGRLQEAAITSGLLLTSLSPEKSAALVNAVPIRLIGTAPLARAISTAGGVALDELDADFMVRRLPGVFAAG